MDQAIGTNNVFADYNGNYVIISGNEILCFGCLFCVPVYFVEYLP